MTVDIVSRETISRRSFIKSSAASGSTLFLGMVLGNAAALVAQAVTDGEGAVRILVPSPATVVAGFLAMKLKWEYSAGDAPKNILLSVALSRDPKHPVAQVKLPGSVTTYALPLVPNETYLWQLQPADADGRATVSATQGRFTMGRVRIVQDAPPEEMYKNPRKGAHYSPFDPIPFGVEEPLSPWYEVKRYAVGPPPKYADVKDQLPCPVFDGHPEALETYWYCWKTFLGVWFYAPYHANHQAVANINGYPTWAGWGSAQVWDSFSQMYYARYGHQVYPFITQYDNAYARQHENGFICQESDNDNFEVYACQPALCPFLIARAEWNYYLVSGDVDRLRRVFTPLAKNYEWFMIYMRRESDGTYGFATPGTRDTCGTDTFSFTFPATALRAVETLAMARIATVIGRADMAMFFRNELQRLSDHINQHFWDAEHQLYNDRCDPNHLWKPFRDPQLAGKFVTEVKPGLLYKPSWTFVPLLAEIVPPERVQALVRLVQDPKGFNRAHGIGHDSVDSTPQGYLTDNDSGPGSIWPPIPQIVQDGFQASGQWEIARAEAEKYFDAVVDAYVKDKTIREYLDSTTVEFKGQPEFVGWGGVAPIGNFIEYVLGIDVNTPEKIIVWHVHRMERHGLQRLKLADFHVDLLCDQRSASGAPCHLTVTSGGEFTLRTIVAERVVNHRILKGTVVLQVG